ncbi:Asp-tRNA(Asn)/Glu-tRNA(Gln) amidotransferase subunit GatB [Patescibacteria group bacterium]|nr:Asp-tRNA(Asn)/Glu-tRNA(Gln) amidotransferase subunit GatB [Patescibacteria group bacterium]
MIGLEIHVQLKTKSKMFCGCDNAGEDQPPNTTVCPICMGHPGTLPVINEQALEWAGLAALALNCKIQNESKFDRKQYFYPDLPKGYQISQYDKPVCLDGFLEIDIPTKDKNKQRPWAKIKINRVHLEEDAAKTFHGEDGKNSLVDYNRSGTPLLEIVTEPDIASPLEAKIFMQELRLIARYLGISDADMEKGHLRCDANISLREVLDNPAKEKTLPKLNEKTEIKNLNSFRAVERALEYEIKRQAELWESGKPPRVTTTRGWNDVKQITTEQRTKEAENDYRYFPEPDLPPLDLSKLHDKIIGLLPELPRAKRIRFINQYEFTDEETKILVEDKKLANYAENVISELKAWLVALEEVEGTEDEIWEKHKHKLVRLVSGWLINKLGGLIADNKIDIRRLKITPENFAEFITMIYQNKISGPTALKILEEMMMTGGDPSQIMESKNLGQISDADELEKIINGLIGEHPDEATEYKQGKTALIQFFIGQTMKKTQGKANPKVAEEIIKKKLS